MFALINCWINKKLIESIFILLFIVYFSFTLLLHFEKNLPSVLHSLKSTTIFCLAVCFNYTKKIFPQFQSQQMPSKIQLYKCSLIETGLVNRHQNAHYSGSNLRCRIDGVIERDQWREEAKRGLERGLRNRQAVFTPIQFP